MPHTIRFSEAEEDKGEKNVQEEDIIIIFWTIYDQLQYNGNGNGRIVSHKNLHQALVSSGKFYAGDATQIISDMVKDGKLELVSFNSYRKKDSGQGKFLVIMKNQVKPLRKYDAARARINRELKQPQVDQTKILFKARFNL